MSMSVRTLSFALTSHLFPKRANSTTLTRGPSPEAMLFTTALVVYRELHTSNIANNNMVNDYVVNDN